MTSVFDAISEPVARRVTSGLVRIGQVLRSRAWKGAAAQGVTPTQGHALDLLREAPDGLSLGEIAQHLGVSPPTASDTMKALVTKGLVSKQPGAAKRSIRLTLTPQGAALAERTRNWPDFLSDAVETLDPAEQAALLGSLIKLIRAMQMKGDIPVQAMCVTCSYFRANMHDDPQAPHHCALVNAPFTDHHLRLACPEHLQADPVLMEANWQRFTE
ncbi:MarR family transcriptional regulator [Novosphingobium sp.]|uniref:MarR family winged helix-turn-helix transcriptional regulator n=1 Tax=Novosphingobium sp. TaxID=1874826 RepID=UPI0031D06438